MTFSRQDLRKTIVQKYIKHGLSEADANLRAKDNVEAMLGNGEEDVTISDADFAGMKKIVQAANN